MTTHALNDHVTINYKPYRTAAIISANCYVRRQITLRKLW